MQLDDDGLFLVGASTAPYAKAQDWPMQEWEKDLLTMRELNFNTVRIFAPWDRIERREGEFDFSKQDYMLEIAARHDMKVILNMGGLFRNPCGCYQPRWLAENHSCHQYQTAPGVTAPMPNRICPDDPIHLDKAMNFMARTIERYAKADALIAWMIWNEPDRREACCCTHTLDLFRHWLKHRYQNLDALNRCWSTESPIEFDCWDEISPIGVPTLNARRDWLAFNQHRLAQTMSEIDQLVGEYDPHRRPTTANLVYHHTANEAEMHGPRLGLDVAQVGQALGIMGVSCYTIAHPFDPRPAWETAYKLSRLRSASRDPARRTLVLETEAGPYVRMITDHQRRQRFYHLLGHNAKSIILWNYRSRLSDGQVGYFHLQKWDGTPSRRARSIGDFAGLLQRHARTLNRVYPQRAAAVLVTEEQQLLSSVTHGGHYVDQHVSRFGAYKLLWDLNIPVDCLAENNLDQMGEFAVILLPMVENMSASMAERLRRYVEAGGTLIAESPFAFKDSDNYLQYRAPGFGLDKLFGGWTSDREGWETASPMMCPDGQAKVHFFWHEFTLSSGQAIAHYADGGVAVVGNSFGKGRTLLAGTEIFRQYVNDPQPAMTALLQREILASGVQPTARVSGDSQNVEVCRLTGPGGLLYFIINHNAHDVSIDVELADSGPWVDFETGEGRDLRGTFTLRSESVLALLKAPESTP